MPETVAEAYPALNAHANKSLRFRCLLCDAYNGSLVYKQGPDYFAVCGSCWKLHEGKYIKVLAQDNKETGKTVKEDN